MNLIINEPALKINEFQSTQKETKLAKRKTYIDKGPFAFGKYFLWNTAIYLIGALALLLTSNVFNTISPWWILSLIPLFLNRVSYIILGFLALSAIVIFKFSAELSWNYLLFFPLAIYLGHLSAVLIHNASHGNFKPKWLNPIIGELLALHQVSGGFKLFQLVHTEHHIHSDDPEKDPHPSRGFGFFKYIDSARNLTITRVTNMYLEAWGSENKSKWNLQMALLMTSRFAKTLFVFCLIGPKAFTLLFLPSYISIILMFSIFNYFTHKEKPDGSIEILNLNHNLYYWLGNKLLFGVYYHKNHHLKPKLFNPMDYVEISKGKVEDNQAKAFQKHL